MSSVICIRSVAAMRDGAAYIRFTTYDAGWDLDWGSVTREEYRSAKHSAYRGDTSALETMFDAILRPANPTRVFLIAGWNQGPAH